VPDSGDRDRKLLDNAIPIPSDDPDPGAVDLTPIEISDADQDDNDSSGSRIHMLGRNDGLDKELWTRTPNANGTGATHCKTFVSKLRLEAIAHMDNHVNEWLEQHPEVEVKFTTSSIGKLVGKVSEDALFLTVWV